jgi:transposase
MADRLACLGVTRVVMEATSDYWKPVFYLLEAAGFETWLVNAKDVKHLPGRPKTDKLDAAWLAKVAERHGPGKPPEPLDRIIQIRPRSAAGVHLDSDLPRQDPAPVRGTGAEPGRR